MKHLLLAALFTSATAFANTCPTYDGDLASSTGAVAAGTTCGALDDDSASCGGAAASEDLVYLWTAPTTGTYGFSLEGSAYDTVVYVKDAGCTELVCNDDMIGLQSYAELAVTAGAQYYVTVDGFSTGRCGDFFLDISIPLDSDGDGVSDGLDMCTGDDASGDSDYDGICDDIDFTLAAAFAGPGAPLTLTATNAPAGQSIYFLASSSYGYVCHPSGLACVDMAHPRVLGSAVANGAGTASLTIVAPAVLPPSIFFQSAWINNGAGTGDASNLLAY